MTTEQIRVSDPNVSAWVAASAGTGKTHVLTNRVLRLLLEVDNPGGLLCLTFTKAAAAEMAGRVNERLAKWAVSEEAVLDKDLAELLDHQPDFDEKDQARRLFAEVLDLPGGLKIQTIHSFCQSLMGRFPLEAQIAPHTQVLDDRSGEQLLAEAVNRTLVAAQRNAVSPLGLALAKVSSLRADTELPKLISALAHDRKLVARSAGRDDVYRQLGLRPDDTDHALVTAACAEGAFDRPALNRSLDALRHGTKTDKDRAEVLAAWLAEDADGRAAQFDAYRGVYLTKAGTIFANLPTKGAREHDDGVVDLLLAEAARIEAVEQARKLCRVAEASVALRILGQAFLTEYETLKTQRAVLDYDDLIEKTRALVTASGNAPWVLYKLDEGIDHILVDEAQDTNSDQWAIIEALAGEFFSGQGARETARTVFAVGDAKQSIYSFQRAEPEEFERTRGAFSRRISAAKGIFHNGLLDLSFRSTETVLGLVDAVFDNPVARAGLVFDDEQRAVSHKAHRSNIAGLVELWPTEEPEVLDAPEPWTPPLRRYDVRPPTVRLAKRITAQIRYWLDNKVELASRNRPIQPDDILILVRRRDGKQDEDTSFFYSVIRELKRADIPVAGVDRMVLTEQLAVMDLMALGDFVLMPDDDLNLAVVLKSPLVGLNEEQLFELAHRRSGTLWQSLTEKRGSNPAFEQAHAFLSQCRSRADFIAPFEFFSGVLDNGARQAMVRRLGPDALDPLDEFLSLAIDYERVAAPSLQGFIRWIRAAETEVKREMEQGKGEVRVMTVHGAKGLQAPIVFLPDTCSVPTRMPSYHWLKPDGEAPVLAWAASPENKVGVVAEAYEAVKAKQLEEYNRQLYVALTRAEDQLFICGYETSRSRSERCWYNLIETGFDALSAVEAPGFDGALVRCFMSGSASDKKSDESKQAELLVPLPAWAKTAPLVEPSPTRPLSPSRPELPDVPVRGPFDATDGNRFLRGTLIHDLLQWLPDIAPAQREARARAYLAKPAYALADADIESWTREVCSVLDDETFAPIFGDGSAAEVSVAGLLGTFAVSGQIDRLAVTSDAVLIVDYKTNRPPPDFSSGVPPLYLRQLAVYRDLMRQIYRGKAVSCALLWTDAPVLMPVEDSLLDPHSPLIDVPSVTSL